MSTATIGTVYLLHFTEPYRHARHYTGTTASSEATAYEEVARRVRVRWELCRSGKAPEDVRAPIFGVLACPALRGVAPTRGSTRQAQILAGVQGFGGSNSMLCSRSARMRSCRLANRRNVQAA